MFKATRHEKMNLPQHPCVNDPDYNFAHCVQKTIVKKTGCLPFWNKFIFNDDFEMPICDNSSMLYLYGDINSQLQAMPRDELIASTGCLMPCSYFEYNVNMWETLSPAKNR